MINAACTLVQNEQGLFLSLYSEERGYSLPGGKLEDDESWQDAAIRETFEETGYEIEVGEHILPFYEGSVKRRGALAGQDVMSYSFVGTVSGIGERIHDHEGEVRWSTEEQLCNDSSYAGYNMNMFDFFRAQGVTFDV